MDWQNKAALVNSLPFELKLLVLLRVYYVSDVDSQQVTRPRTICWEDFSSDHMDQTEFSVNSGFMFGAPLGAIVIHSLTEWSGWIAYSLGGVVGFFLVVCIVYIAIGFIGRLQDRRKSKTTEE